MHCRSRRWCCKDACSSHCTSTDCQPVVTNVLSRQRNSSPQNITQIHFCIIAKTTITCTCWVLHNNTIHQSTQHHVPADQRTGNRGFDRFGCIRGLCCPHGPTCGMECPSNPSCFLGSSRQTSCPAPLAACLETMDVIILPSMYVTQTSFVDAIHTQSAGKRRYSRTQDDASACSS